MRENEFKDLAVKRINIKETIKESWQLYKDNFKLFITISLVSFIINYFNFGIREIDKFLSFKDPLLAFYILKFLILIVVSFYSIKITITMYICISMRYKNTETSFKYCYNAASKKIWRYIGTSIKLALILLIPSIVLFIANYISRGGAGYIFSKMMIIPIFYLAAVNGFAPIISIFEDDNISYFKLSRKIVKGDFWRIMLLVLLTSIVFTIPYTLYIFVFNKLREASPYEKLIVSSINQIVSLFTTPFSLSAQLIMYLKLKENKIIEQP